jgi:hypothetical protein
VGADHHPGAGHQPAPDRRPFLVEALKEDPLARRDAEACLALGISPRRFEGWEPKQRTSYTYDGDGQLVSSTTTREPEWDDEDRAIIYAILDYRADLCPGCGQPMSDYLHKDGEPDPKVSPSYTVCVACVAKERGFMIQDRKDQMVEKSGGVVYRSARRWLLVRPT